MKTIILFIAGLGLFVSGCASLLAASYNYNLAVKNTSNQEIWCSLVASSKGISHEPGRLIPGAEKTISGPFKAPYADKWTVAWKTVKGEQFEKVLELTDKFPKTKLEGRRLLVLTIDSENNLSFALESTREIENE